MKEIILEGIAYGIATGLFLLIGWLFIMLIQGLRWLIDKYIN